MKGSMSSDWHYYKYCYEHGKYISNGL
jgi:hypothetical protein